MIRRIITTMLVLAGAVASSTAATNVSPAANAVNVNPDGVTLAWVSAPQTNAVRTKVYLAVNSGAEYLISYTTYTNSLTLPAVLEPNTDYEWTVDDCDYRGAVITNWPGAGVQTKFTTGTGDHRRAITPIPANGSIVTAATDNVLQWSAGSGAATGVTYNVYFGKDSTIDETEFRGNFTNRSFTAGILTPGTRYHWRIDTVDTNGTSVIKGCVWSLTAGINPVSYTDTNTLLFADEFEHGILNQCPTNWTRQGTPQLRALSGHGKVVKLSGTGWIERRINAWGMQNIKVSYRCSLTGYTNYNGYMRCQMSTDGGANWTNLRSKNSGEFSDSPSVVTCSSVANNQADLRIRFLSDATNTLAYTYLDHVKISGVYAPVLPAHDPNSPAIGNATVILLGDSVTSNNGTKPEHWAAQFTNLFPNATVLSAYAGLEAQIVTNNGVITTNYIPTRVHNHGKGGSRAYCGEGYENLTPYAVTNSVIDHGSDASGWDLGGYQRLKYAFEEADLHTNNMVIPDYVIINFGMNDHKRTLKNGINTEMSTPADFTNHLTMIVNLVRSRGAIPILVVPHDFYTGSTDSFESYYSLYSPELFNYASDNYSALGRFHLFTDGMKTVAQNMGVDLIDLNRAATEYDGNEFTVNGGVHLDDLGHNVYIGVIGDYLNAKYGD